ncbi:hypothetical protein GGR25_000187 [Kaistia hirudinis]|uniref:DUF2062 domain-containing protein n=1 Tax=Kaistia hirudinis TaxID=1293440 RepID=A0A840AIA2_9HYPH|nr:DUF2062 domain-containing protein [Kaistia hirudinis]MBB3929168.1 hypothetical protein [Kaistia hirudinis]
MLFRRRKPLRFHEKFSHVMWPRRGFKRAVRYHSKRLMRMSGSPHSVAAGFAVGVALSMTPFVGFHYLLCFVAAYLVRGNVLAAVLGTTIGNPLTFPIIWLTTYETGGLVLGWFGRRPEALSFRQISHGLLSDSAHSIWPIFEPMLIGSIPVALVTATISYIAVYYATDAFRTARRERVAIRRRELHGNRS